MTTSELRKKITELQNIEIKLYEDNHRLNEKIKLNNKEMNTIRIQIRKLSNKGWARFQQ